MVHARAAKSANEARAVCSIRYLQGRRGVASLLIEPRAFEHKPRDPFEELGKIEARGFVICDRDQLERCLLVVKSV